MKAIIKHNSHDLQGYFGNKYFLTNPYKPENLDQRRIKVSEK
jgi:hypothetical protein